MNETPLYTDMAPHYDWLMNHVDYKRWSRHIARLCRHYGLEPRHILEIASGTAPFKGLPPFPRARMILSDLSPSMLRIARRGETSPNRDLVAADGMALPFKGGFDLCLMIYDSINYLLDEEEISLMLNQVHAQLVPGGLFLFDATTLSNSKRYFRNATYFDERPGCSVVRESEYDEDLRLQYNDFTFFFEDESGRFVRKVENHLQRIYPLDELTDLCEKSGFKILGCHANFGMTPARESAERAHFVARREQG